MRFSVTHNPDRDPSYCVARRNKHWRLMFAAGVREIRPGRQLRCARQERTGLGLRIVKEIVRQMGGDVGFVDAPGGGTIFFADLPRPHRAVGPDDRLGDGRPLAIGSSGAGSARPAFASARTARQAGGAAAARAPQFRA